MILRTVQAVILGMLLASAACTETSGYRVEKYFDVNFNELPEDVKIPSAAWDLLEMKSGAHGDGHGGEAPQSAEISFAEITVFLAQKNPGVVEREAVRIHLSKGGGTIDLAQFIGKQNGSFYLGFDFPKFANAKSKKVIFVSGARRRKVNGQIFGAGCNQILDITDRFFKEMAGEGIKVNTTQERYIGVIGGTFLFSAQTEKGIHVAQVTFKNSLLPNLFCKGQ